jgi:alanine dehydrogenase
MSKIAGRMAPQVAAHFLERPQGGRGILLGGIDGVPAAQVVVIGGGVVGRGAAEVALGMGADVAILVRSARTADQLSQRFGNRARIFASPDSIASLCASADAVIAAALVPGAAAPKLISAGTVKCMKHGAVIVDVSIDQGGRAETSHPTTHSQPTFIVDGIVHYCVANMPGAVPRTSTFALNDATRPFIVAIANKGLSQALADNEHLRNGLNVHDGQITYRAVADALRLPHARVSDVLAV